MDDSNRPATDGVRRPPADTAAARRRAIGLLAVIGTVLALAFVAAFVYVQGWIPPRDPAPGVAVGSPSPTGSGGSPSCTPTPTGPAPSAISVNIYNSTDRSGLAASTAAALKEQGFVVGTVGNDPQAKKVAGTAEIRFRPAAADKAAVVARRFSGAALVSDDKRTGDVVDVAVGAKFASVAPAPSTSPAC